MEKRKINFIITVYDREEYAQHLIEILNDFKTIEAITCVAYNGEDENFQCDVRIENKGHQQGDFDLTTEGYKYLIERDSPSDIFVKLSVDSWLCDEDVINRIIDGMIFHKVPYAGNWWNTNHQLSTDIFFSHISYGNIFENIKFDGPVFESCMFNVVARLGGRFFIIPDREPVHPLNRNSCEGLGWTMEHKLEKNLKFLKEYRLKKPMKNIKQCYAVMCQRPSDINQLLPTIHKYALECSHITEFGVREVVSTWAFLAANPKTLRSYDIEDCPVQYAESLAIDAKINFKFQKQDVIDPKFEIEETDLLFIDTWHRYDQLKQELVQHAQKVRKYIVLHDTETFGLRDEEESNLEKQPQGLLPAIEEFLNENKNWSYAEKLEINNGLTVLKNDRTI